MAPQGALASELADIQALAARVAESAQAARHYENARGKMRALEASIAALEQLTALAARAGDANAAASGYARQLEEALRAEGVTLDNLHYAQVGATLAHATALTSRAQPDAPFASPGGRPGAVASSQRDMEALAYIRALEIEGLTLRARALLDIVEYYRPRSRDRAASFLRLAKDTVRSLPQGAERVQALVELVTASMGLGPSARAIARQSIGLIPDAGRRAQLRHQLTVSTAQGTASPPDRLLQRLRSAERDANFLNPRRNHELAAVVHDALEASRSELALAAAFSVHDGIVQAELLLDLTRHHLERGFPTLAVRVARFIVDPGVAARAYALAGEALAEQGFLLQAQAAFDSAFSQADITEASGQGSTSARLRVLEIMARAGLTARVEEALSSYDTDGQLDGVYAALAITQGDQENNAAALGALEQIQDRSLRQATAARLAMSLMGRPDYETAVRPLLASLPSSDHRDRILAARARHLVGDGRYDAAMADAKAIDAPGLHLRTEAIVRRLAVTQRFDGATVGLLTKAAEMVQAANALLVKSKALADPGERALALSALATLYMASGETAKGRTLLNDLPVGVARDEGTAFLVRMLGASGAIDTALAALDDIADPALAERVLGSLARDQLEAGQLDSAVELARQMPSDRVRAAVYSDMARYLAASNDVDARLRNVADGPLLPEAGDGAGDYEPRSDARNLDDELDLRVLEGVRPRLALPEIRVIDQDRDALRAEVPAIRPGRAHEALMIYSKFNRKFFEQSGWDRWLPGMQGVPNPRYIYLEEGVFDLGAIVEDLEGTDAESAITREGDTVTVRLPILISPRASLVISGSEVSDVHLSTGHGAFLVNAGSLYVTDTRIAAVDLHTGEPSWRSAKQLRNFRPFILSWSGSNTVLLDSTFDALGYGSSKAFGLSLSSGPRYLIKSNENALPPAGSIIGNTFRNLHFGFYTFEADGVVVTDNEYIDNVVYGVDPHDRSSELVVAYNTIYGTKIKHGLIISREVNHSLLVGNLIFDNEGSGIMLDRSSEETVVYANTVFGNHGDGIALFESSCNIVARNHVTANARTGVKVRNSFDVAVMRNHVRANGGAAIEAYTLALESSPAGEARDFELDPYLPLATVTAVENDIVGNGTGISSSGASSITLDRNRFVGQSRRLFGGELRSHSLDVMVAASADRGALMISRRCVPARPKHVCGLREDGRLGVDGQAGLLSRLPLAENCGATEPDSANSLASIRTEQIGRERADQRTVTR